MIMRAIDGSGDWTFGLGLSNYNKGNAAIAENVQTRLQFFVRDCFFAYNRGIDWLRLLGTKGTQVELELTCRAIILQSYGVVKVNSLTTVLNRVTRAITLTYNIDTILTAKYTNSVTMGAQ